MAFDPRAVHADPTGPGDGTGPYAGAASTIPTIDMNRREALARRLLHDALTLARQTEVPKARRPAVVWVRPRNLILHMSARVAGHAMARQTARARETRAWTRDRLGSVAADGRDAVRRTGRRMLAPIDAFGSDPANPKPPSRTLQR